MPFSVVALCVASAGCYALSSVLQQREARNVPMAKGARFALVAQLLHRPRWLLGNLAGAGALVLQFLALRHASLALVQPLLVIGLVFALAGGAVLDHRRPSPHELLWTALTMGGLALFLVASRPGPGLARGSGIGWIVLGAIVVAALAGLAHLASGGDHRQRALSLATAAGLLGGVFSALLERTAHIGGPGIAAVLTDWPPYALIVCAVLAFTVTQSAYQSGDIRLSLPALTAVEPIVAIAIGQLLFGEHIALRGLAPVGEIAGLMMMTAGVFGLGQTVGPALEHATAPPPRGGGTAAPRDAAAERPASG